MGASATASVRRGFTLLELILALGLTVIVLLIVSTGVEVQLRAFDRSRARVERAQLARVLLHRMADDVGDMLEPGAESESSPFSAGSSGAMAATAGGTTSTGAASTTGAAGAGNTASADSTGDEASGSVATTTVTPPPAGVYGELDWLRIDVVRPPHREEGSSGASASSSDSGSSSREIHTIVYYVLTAEEATAQNLAEDSKKPAGGLVRRELTRPVAAWASGLGLLEYRDPSVKPLAPEVTTVEFRYHDGVDWVESWDTDVEGGMPKAIEIRLFLSPLSATPGRAAPATTGSTESLPDVQYRLVVSLPLQEGEASSAAGTSEESSTESGSTSSGSSESSGSNESASGSGGTP